tara:strand:+ start:416 stop:814 length:399 start_codon:yes stop_codon:yes gene_type:complete
MHYRNNNNKNKRFRYRSNGRSGRSYQTQSNGLSRPMSSPNGRSRNNFKNYQSADKLIEKYSTLAKEALSKGDVTDAENYFQHADHFVRILEEKNLIQNSNKDSSNNEKEVKKDIDQPKIVSTENKVVEEKKE